MRIIKLLLKNFFRLVILLSLIFFGGREIILALGKSQIKQSLTVLRRLDLNRDYQRRCQEADYLGGNLNPVLQLRFINDREYIVEILCQPYATEAITVDKKSLSWLVKKLPGQSGIIWGEQTSGITLSVLGRTASIGIKAKVISNLKAEEISIIGPQSICTGYGFLCCLPATQIGEGAQLIGATDCPQSCFSSCISRPEVVTFNTQPGVDPATRSVTINANDELIFAYNISTDADQVRVKIDFGDGQVESYETESAVVTHIYQCGQPLCEYRVALEAEDQNGLTTANLPINQLVVIVQGVP